MLFDDDAVYVGARLYDAAPDSVTAVLARRDRPVSADRFLVFLDPYHDHRSGFYFGINAAGTLYDGTLYNDDWNDDTWDGVWEGRAARDSLGWTAELRIPYSQLRFQRKAVYVWGVNFGREIARRNEQDYLVVRPTNGSGFVSRFVDLVGIERVSPRPRIEVMPYVTARAAGPAGRRPGRQGRHRRQSHARRHGEPRLRPGGGRSGRGQSQRRRDLLPREASLLRRGAQHLQLRVWRRERLLGVQLARRGLPLHPAYRPRAPAGAAHGRFLR